MGPQEILKNFGLETKESKAYLALLELGEGTVYALSKKAGLKRPTLYLILSSLESKGFVVRVIRGKKLFFAAQHPRKLVTEAELRLREVREVMPQLESLLHTSPSKPRIRIFEGLGELDRAYDESFLAKGEIMYIGTLSLSKGAFPRTFQKIEYAKLSPDFKLRELIDESEESYMYARAKQGDFREIRLIPKELLPFTADIGIFGNQVLITSLTKEHFTISIESEELTQAFRTLFNALWGVSKVV